MTKSGRRKRKKVSSPSSFEGNTTFQQEEDDESDTETSAAMASNDNCNCKQNTLICKLKMKLK